MMKPAFAVLLCFASCSALAQSPLPRPSKGRFLCSDCVFTNLYTGFGASHAGAANQTTALAGAEIGQTRSWLFDVGILGPLASGQPLAGHVSVDLNFNFPANRTNTVMVFPMGGYSYVFGAGNSVNLGGGTAIAIGTHALRLEILDFFIFGSPQQNNLTLRIGWGAYIPD